MPQKLMAEVGGFLLETVLVVGVTYHFVHGYDLGVAAKDQLAAVAAEQVKYAALEKTANATAAALENEKAKERTLYAKINQNLSVLLARPLYSTVCVDADGVRNINAALAGADPTSPSQPSAAVPSDHPASGNDGRRPH
jgi:hypothetical protein